MPGPVYSNLARKENNLNWRGHKEQSDFEHERLNAWVQGGK